MDLRNKYSRLINYAKASGVDELSVTEQNNVLHITGKTDANTKQAMWDIYNEIDPDMRAGDLILDIEEVESPVQEYEVKAGDNLSKIAKNYPGLSWKDIYEANKDTVKDANVIFPGQKLKIPVKKTEQ